MSLSWFESTVELHQTGTFERCASDSATAPQHFHKTMFSFGTWGKPSWMIMAWAKNKGNFTRIFWGHEPNDVQSLPHQVADVTVVGGHEAMKAGVQEVDGVLLDVFEEFALREVVKFSCCVSNSSLWSSIAVLVHLILDHDHLLMV